jgi:hypothetical protein
MANLEFFMKQNDTAPSLAIKVINKSDGLPLDLTGASAVFSMRLEGETTPKVDGSSADVYDEAGGRVRYDWAAADTDTVGVYEGEFEVTLLGGGIVTFPQDGYIKITILEEV